MLKSMLSSLVLVTVASVAAAQSPVRLTVAPSSTLILAGGSNVHDWSCKAPVDATIDVDASKADGAEFAKALLKAQIKVPVASIKCGKDGMDKNLYKALKSDESPLVTWTLGTYTVSPGAAKDAFVVKTEGKLVVAGAERTVKLDLTATRLPNGTVKAIGELPMLMTDFGIKPPTAMLGAMKTKNEVTVKFDLLLGTQKTVAERD